MANKPLTSQPTDETAKLTPAQIEAVADRNGEIYRHEMFRTTWKTRSQTLWSGGVVGIAFGAAIGLATAAAAVIAGAASSVILPVVGAFAVGGMLTGVAAFTDTGIAVGAMAAGEKARDRKKLIENPSQGLRESIEYRKAAEANKGKHKIFNWKTALVFGAAGLALGGLLVATGGLGLVGAAAAGVHAATGATLSSAATTAMTLTATTLFGAAFGVDIPTIGANVTEFMGNIFSGKAFRRSEPQPQADLSAAPPLRASVTRQPAISAEETAILNERLAAGGNKDFTQLATQQAQNTPANLTIGA